MSHLKRIALAFGFIFGLTLELLSQNNHSCSTYSLIDLKEIPTCEKSFYLAFEDDFEHEGKFEQYWHTYIGRSRDMDVTHQIEFLRKENVIFENGNLVLRALKSSTPQKLTYQSDKDSLTKYFSYFSGEIRSKLTFGYGYYEIEARIPSGLGTWPAFWMHEGLQDYKEIDVFEITKGTDVLGTNIHVKKPGKDCPLDILVNKFLGLDFHKYGLLYTSTSIIWYLDGKIIRQHYRYKSFETGEDISCENLVLNNTYLETDKFPVPPLYIDLNLAILKTIRGDVEFPQDFAIKYFRYYKSVDCLDSLNVTCDYRSGIDSINIIVANKVSSSLISPNCFPYLKIISSSNSMRIRNHVVDPVSIWMDTVENTCDSRIDISVPNKKETQKHKDVRIDFNRGRTCVINNSTIPVKEFRIYNSLGELIQIEELNSSSYQCRTSNSLN
ncbi:MAG: glycoside hydrolase family 16 protein [Flavobacteriales bacterium]|nr:glycoside hydrolase family 16 protein [Flavobacteriales bacterium]